MGELGRRSRRLERGAAAVEFALVVPILIMLLFGSISFGIVFAQKIALGNGARQGARTGVVSGVTCALIVSEAKDASSSIAMSGSAVTVTVTRGATAATATNACGASPSTSTTQPCTGSTTGDSIFVNTTYNSQLIIPPVIFKNPYVIGGDGVFSCEFQ